MPASAARGHILVEKLLASTSDGVGIKMEKLRQEGIAPVAEFEGFQACEQAALLFIEQAIEKQNGRLEFVRWNLNRGDVDGQWHGVSGSADSDLIFR